jgi:hypothetical protein
MKGKIVQLTVSSDLTRPWTRRYSRRAYPSLGPHRVLGGPVEGLDARALFEPEEQFHLPTGLVRWATVKAGRSKSLVRQGILYRDDRIHILILGR